MPVRRILLATAHPYLPQLVGGAQVNMHETALELVKRGHNVAVSGGLTREGGLGMRARGAIRLLRRPAARDCTLGYPVYRSWYPWESASYVSQKFRPDIVIAQSGLPARIGKAFRNAGNRVIVYFHNVESDDLVGMEDFRADGWIANSKFTAATVLRRYSVAAHVIAPVFHSVNFRVPTQGKAVTFINPHPHKGFDTAIDVARACPELPFLFVRAWTLGSAEERDVSSKIAALQNAELMGPFDDMRRVYERTRVLLLPSRWEEAWGRVATEAHYSGIPVVGVRRGGIPEAVGPGGILIDADAPLSSWVDAIRTLMRDQSVYDRVSRAASNYSGRSEINLRSQMASLEGIIEQVIAKSDEDKGWPADAPICRTA